MPSDQKDRYIQYLTDKINELDLNYRAIQLALEEFQPIFDAMKEDKESAQKEAAEARKRLDEVKAELLEATQLLKRVEEKNAKLEQQLKYAKKMGFGSKEL